MTMLDPSDRSNPSRRSFLALGVGAFVVATLPRALGPRRRMVRRTVPVMGTVAEFAVVHHDAAAAEAAIDAAVAELNRVERLMTRFSRHSEIGRANLLAAAGPVAVSAETALVIREALRWAEASDGAFDPCLGAVTDLWDVKHRQAPPSAAEVLRVLGTQPFRHLELDRHNGESVVHFTAAGVQLDLGGIAKGYGVDLAVKALRAHGIRDAIVNVGGDLYAMGVSEEGDPWRVGIRDPQDPRRLIGKLKVTDGAVATSGDYMQYFEHHGRRYHHILDPRTGEPRRVGMHSITIAADDCMAADAAATTFFGAPRAEADRSLAVIAPAARIVHEV